MTETATYAPKGKNRDTEALRLRITGWDLDSIAHHLGWEKPAQAATAIKRAVSNMARFAGDEQRLIEIQKLDKLEKELWTVLQRRHWAYSSRGTIVLDPYGQPIEDDRIVLETIDRIVKVAERRARLMGLDAPLRAEVLTIDSVDAEIARLEAELTLARKPNQIVGAAKALEHAKMEKQRSIIEADVITSDDDSAGEARNGNSPPGGSE